MATILLLVGNLFLGISHIAFLPPWEGFDETAHYSSIQQIADTWEIPRQKRAFISREVEEYLFSAPLPYNSIPPMEKNGGYTYKSFFASSPSVVKKGYDYIHQQPDQGRHFYPGTGINWQAQHPPLYYLILAPIYLITRGMSWGEQLFMLRLISYLFAWMALIIGIYGLSIVNHRPNHEAPVPYWAPLGIAVWPILWPSWFPAMARLGNDSLCALLMALIWVFWVKIAAKSNGSRRDFFVLGGLLSLGCLTKAFFVPVTIGFIGYWGFRLTIWDGQRLRQSAYRLIIVPIMILGISGWWYVANWVQYGVWLGSDEMIYLRQAGGLLKGLYDHFSLTAWIRGHAAFITTLSWCGSWSLARPHYIYLAPLVSLSGLVTIAYAFSLKRKKGGTQPWLPLWSLLPVLMGFSTHVLVRIALSGEGRGTSGYYLNFMVVPLGVMAGLGLHQLWGGKTFRALVSILTVYSLLFYMVVTWAQILLYAGILFKAGDSKFYQFPEKLPAGFGLPEALERLQALAFPNTGALLWIIGNLLTLSGVILIHRRLKKQLVAL